jgi:hypothetical protein
VQVPDNKEVANHVVPESCAVHREVRCEALTGVRIGQQLSRDRKNSSRVPTLSPRWKAKPTGAPATELGTYGSVRGVPGNGHPYRNHSRYGVDRARARIASPPASANLNVSSGPRCRQASKIGRMQHDATLLDNEGVDAV